MNKGIVASQLHFTKGASPLEFVVSYGTEEVGVVIRKAAGKNTRWEMDGEPECAGKTREEAATMFLSKDLRVALPPLMSHRWVSTSNGPIGMRYQCPGTGQTYDNVGSTPTLSQVCMGCGEPVSFNQPYAETVVYTQVSTDWVLSIR